ncbi:NAD-dependent epimerase/dehydratase family protein [Patescibacteria group bacterium]
MRAKKGNKNINVLVTGGAGFLGREVVKQLVEMGYRVRVVDLLKKPSKFPGNEYIKGDLTDPKIVKKSFRKIDYCIHLAAKTGGIGYYHKYPGTIINGNNRLYSSVFEAAVKYKLKRIIYTSSSLVYGSTGKFPIKEIHLGKYPSPASSYGFSKLVGEYYCRFYWEEFGLPYTICRLFNLYGPIPLDGIVFSHVIPDIAKKIISGQYPVEILGDGNQTRCFTHVEDTARGIILAMRSLKAKNEDFNLGSNQEVKILDLAKMIFKYCYPRKKFKFVLKDAYKMDVTRQTPVFEKAKKVLGWEPTKRLESELPYIIGEIKKGK